MAFRSTSSAASLALLLLLASLAVSTATGLGSSSSPSNPSARNVAFSRRRTRSAAAAASLTSSRESVSAAADAVPRGGSTRAATRPEDDEEGDDDDVEARREAEEEARKVRAALAKYRSDQSVLLQLRSTLLSEALAQRGVPLPTLRDVCTTDGDRPAEKCDWDCALSTVEEPKTCLYSFDAEPDTKVVAPLGTDQWISLSALNRLRRTDPTKVEPMWHGRYAILQSWFSDESEYSLLQHVGIGGFLVSSVLLDLGGGMVLRSLLALAVLSALCVSMPLLEYLVGRILVSSALWSKWISWHRIVHAALPFKLLVGQIAWKSIAGAFAKLEGAVRERAVDFECAILEECVPVTVGMGVEEESEEEEDDDEVADLEGEDYEDEEDSEYDEDYDEGSDW
eukprot:CAMPEP_0113564606 /NCGR_PEP_ID=MMETSP0015_2-20120614/21713_1 /TAXON_ID=2838 /ORGANISM="Odontella" /LENGTH=395 /DNA_ID=CAMNT_0000466707 /DNA_START=23 /DNA_END=1210 /DNA_ORIENTATION=+ /assembly_acc=CAM_ASM_000160